MTITETLLKAADETGTGQVRRFSLPDANIAVTQITAFNPELLSPGPTHVYLIEGDALLMVDTGLPTQIAKVFSYTWQDRAIPEAVAKLPDDFSLQQIVKGVQSAGYAMEDVDGLIISHGHPDHFFNGRKIQALTGAKTLAHIMDAPEISSPWGMVRNWMAQRLKLQATGMRSHRKPLSYFGQSENIDALGLSLNIDFPIFDDGRLEMDGETIPHVTIRHIPGHSPGGIGLIVGNGDEKLICCGDTLLDPITTIPDNLLHYLRTLAALKSLEDIAWALPGHGRIIRNIPERIAFFEAHHHKRLKNTFDGCRQPVTVWDIAAIPDYFDVHIDPGVYNPLAGKEVISHLELLQMADGIHRSDIKNGIHYFQNSGEAFDDVYDRVMTLVGDDKVNMMMQH